MSRFRQLANLVNVKQVETNNNYSGGAKTVENPLGLLLFGQR